MVLYQREIGEREAKCLNDTSAQLRKELAIWLLILERFAVS